MNDLNEKSLEQVIDEIMKLTKDRGKRLSIRPTKMLMFPGATEEDRAHAVEIERKAREKFNDRQ